MVGGDSLGAKADKMTKTIGHCLMTFCLAILLLTGFSAQGAGPLPTFTFKGIALHPKDLSFAPTGALERSCLIKMEGRVNNPLGKYYLYYSPHKHAGVGLVYSDSIEGPWTEYKSNRIVEDAAIPDVRWIEETGKFHLWAHRKNSQTEMWTSTDGLHFEYHSISVSAKNIDTRNATYTRAYEYPLERHGNKYIMLYSGFIEERGIRCVWLAHSKGGENWVQEKTPLVEPVEGENNDIYGPAMLRWQGRNFVVYQDHTGYRGGLVKYVELDSQLHPVGDQGQRYVLIDPVPDSPIDNRYRGGEFYREGDTLYLYSGGGENPRIIVYATARTEDANSTQEIQWDEEPEPQTDGDTPKKKKQETKGKGETGQVQPTSVEKAEHAPTVPSSLDQVLDGVELETVYETDFEEPLHMIHEDDLIENGMITGEPPEDVDWVLEGPAEVFVESGRMQIRNSPDGNCVLWNTREFPESFVAEWDFQHHKPQGTVILFFAARGEMGGSIFAPGLPKRGGNFGNYTKGKIRCYHTSYSATDEDGVPRGATHLKKDIQDENLGAGGKVAAGPSLIDGKTGKAHRIRLAKLGNRIILEVNGVVSFDWTDQGEKGGTPFKGGQIGFRQMRHTIEASYGGIEIQRVRSQAE